MYCNIQNFKMAYHRSGVQSAPTIIFVHGITTYSFIWSKLLPYFEKDFDVITIDLIGCGDSDKPLDVSYSLKEHSKRLFEFTNILDIKTFHLIGHDVGGVAQIFSVNHENVLLSLTMINMVAYNYWPVQPITAISIPVLRQFIMGAFELGLFKVIIKTGLFHKELVTPELVALFKKPLMTSLGRKAFMLFAKDLNPNDLMEISNDLKNLKLPVLIIRGDADPFLSSIIAEKLAENIEQAKLVRIDSASHYLMEKVYPIPKSH